MHIADDVRLQSVELVYANLVQVVLLIFILLLMTIYHTKVSLPSVLLVVLSFLLKFYMCLPQKNVLHES